MHPDRQILRALPSDSRLRDSSLRNPTAKCTLPMNGEGAFWNESPERRSLFGRGVGAAPPLSVSQRYHAATVGGCK